MNNKKYKTWSALRSISLTFLIFALLIMLPISFADIVTRTIYYIILALLVGFAMASFMEASRYKTNPVGKSPSALSPKANKYIALCLGLVIILIVFLWLIPEIIKANS
jgi:hypothetical protein